MAHDATTSDPVLADAIKTMSGEIEDGSVEKDSRQLVCVISTDALDRDKEVVVPSGIDLGQWNKNKVVLWAHKYDATPVASGLWAKIDAKGRLVAKIQFSAKNAFSREIFSLYQEGFLNAFSVGLRIVNAGPPLPVEKMDRPELQDCWRIIRRSLLLEFSALPVPSNQEALALAVAKGTKASLSSFARKELGLPERPRVVVAPGWEPSHKAASSRANAPRGERGVALMMPLPSALAEDLAIASGEPSETLHVTLAYLGKARQFDDATLEAIAHAAGEHASTRDGAIAARIGGLGRFSGSPSSDGKDALYASVDSSDLHEFRAGLVDRLDAIGVRVDRQHGFTPHVTLAYLDPKEPSPIDRIDPRSVALDALALGIGGDWTTTMLGSRPESLKTESEGDAMAHVIDPNAPPIATDATVPPPVDVKTADPDVAKGTPDAVSPTPSIDAAKCVKCAGMGEVKGDDGAMTSCSACNGTGTMAPDKKGAEPEVVKAAPDVCGKCAGSGQYASKEGSMAPCEACKGTGRAMDAPATGDASASSDAAPDGHAEDAFNSDEDRRKKGFATPPHASMDEILDRVMKRLDLPNLERRLNEFALKHERERAEQVGRIVRSAVDRLKGRVSY